MNAPTTVTQKQLAEFLLNGAVAKAGLNTSILDAGWGQFQDFCVAKAESAGRQVVFCGPLQYQPAMQRV
jgi:putative transposase